MPIARGPRPFLAAGLVAALAVGALWLGRSVHFEPDPRTAVVALSQEPDVLNPYLSPLQSASSLSTLFYSGLVTLDDHGQWVPDLAQRVPSVQNGDVKLLGGRMTVTYHLRSGVTWQDGKPLTSRDVAATWRLLMNARFPVLSSAGYDQLAAVETPDAHQVRLVFKTPYAPYLELFPFVFASHVIAGDAPAQAPWNRSPVGTGPYRLERWLSGDRLVASANASYFRGRPGIPKLTVRFVSHEETALNLWRSGEIDVLQGAAPAQYDVLQREAPAAGLIHLTPSTTWEHVLFNLEHPVVGDRRVRKALAHLIDRQQILSKAYGDVFLPAWSEVPTFSWAYNRQVENRYAYDKALAGRLLDEAGWKLGSDGLRHKGAKPLALTLLTTSDKPSRTLAAQIWRHQWRELGIDLSVEKEVAGVLFGSAASGGRLAKGDFDLALVASLSRPDPDTSFRWRSDQVPPSGQNRARYRNMAVDALLLEGQRTIPPDRRRPLYGKLAEHLIDDLPVLPLLYWVNIDATSERLSGFRPNPTLRGNLWNVWEWKIKKS